MLKLKLVFHMTLWTLLFVTITIASGIPSGRRTCQQSHASMICHWMVVDPAVDISEIHSVVYSSGILGSPETDLGDHQISKASRQNAETWNLVAEIDALKQQQQLVVDVHGLGGEPAVGSVAPVPVAVEGSAEVAGFAVAAEAAEAAVVVAAVIAVVAVLLGFAADPVVSVLVDAASEPAVEVGGQSQRPDRYQSVPVPV